MIGDDDSDCGSEDSGSKVDITVINFNLLGAKLPRNILVFDMAEAEQLMGKDITSCVTLSLKICQSCHLTGLTGHKVAIYTV